MTTLKFFTAQDEVLYYAAKGERGMVQIFQIAEEEPFIRAGGHDLEAATPNTVQTMCNNGLLEHDVRCDYLLTELGWDAAAKVQPLIASFSD